MNKMMNTIMKKGLGVAVTAEEAHMVAMSTWEDATCATATLKKTWRLPAAPRVRLERMPRAATKVSYKIKTTRKTLVVPTLQVAQLQRRNQELQCRNQELQQRNEDLQAQPREDAQVAKLMVDMLARSDKLEKQNEELELELDEVYALVEQMSNHIETLEIQQQLLSTYANQLCTDKVNVKRRAVRQKFEFDEERQVLVEELHQWKRKAEELLNTEKDAAVAAEAKVAWDVACLNQTIGELKEQLLAIKTELDYAKEELFCRRGSVNMAAETELLLDALQDLALDLKSQLDESKVALGDQARLAFSEIDRLEAQLDESKFALDDQARLAIGEIDRLEEIIRDMKERAIKDALERQELMDELLMWKDRALGSSELTRSETRSAPSIDLDIDVNGKTDEPRYFAWSCGSCGASKIDYNGGHSFTFNSRPGFRKERRRSARDSRLSE